MSELLPRPPDSYRPIFETIENAADCSTAEAYSMYVDFVRQNDYDPCIYLSMAITSGGYARDKTLPFTEVLVRNASHGELIADALAQQYSSLGIKKSDIVMPATLGKVAGWNQADYLLFWGHVISGIDPALAERIDSGVRHADITNLPGFFDKSLDRAAKWLDYKHLVDEYVSQLNQLPRPIYPMNMQAVILALDAEESLGVNAERYLCHQLGLGEYTFGVDAKLGIAEDLDSVRQLGATTLFEGIPNISGHHNVHATLRRRAQGQYFRKSGILSGIIDRREASRALSPNIISP